MESKRRKNNLLSMFHVQFVNEIKVQIASAQSVRRKQKKTIIIARFCVQQSEVNCVVYSLSIIFNTQAECWRKRIPFMIYDRFLARCAISQLQRFVFGEKSLKRKNYKSRSCRSIKKCIRWSSRSKIITAAKQWQNVNDSKQQNPTLKIINFTSCCRHFEKCLTNEMAKRITLN
jgi:hypothetical protein